MLDIHTHTPCSPTCARNYCVWARCSHGCHLFCFHCASANRVNFVFKKVWTQRRPPPAWKSSKCSYLCSEGARFLYIEFSPSAETGQQQWATNWKYWTNSVLVFLWDFFSAFLHLKKNWKHVLPWFVLVSQEWERSIKGLINLQARRQSCPRGRSSVWDRN